MSFFPRLKSMTTPQVNIVIIKYMHWAVAMGQGPVEILEIFKFNLYNKLYEIFKFYGTYYERRREHGSENLKSLLRGDNKWWR